MKPTEFDYYRPETVDDAVRVLAEKRNIGETKILAGGQSLIPMMNFRLVRPDLIIDINQLIELDYIKEVPGGGLVVGALTRHRTLITSALVQKHFPIISNAMRYVAHLAIRNRGTIGGSICQADPAAELPLLAKLLDAVIVVRSQAGERRILAEQFFAGAMTPSLHVDELVTHIEFPGVRHSGWGFREFGRRPGDFALAAVGVILQMTGAGIESVSLGIMGVGDSPVRSHTTEEFLKGKVLSEDVIAVAARIGCDNLVTRTDFHASSAFRTHLVKNMINQVLQDALERATEKSYG